MVLFKKWREANGRKMFCRGQFFVINALIQEDFIDNWDIVNCWGILRSLLQRTDKMGCLPEEIQHGQGEQWVPFRGENPPPSLHEKQST